MKQIENQRKEAEEMSISETDDNEFSCAQRLEISINEGGGRVEAKNSSSLFSPNAPLIDQKIHKPIVQSSNNQDFIPIKNQAPYITCTDLAGHNTDSSVTTVARPPPSLPESRIERL